MGDRQMTLVDTSSWIEFLRGRDNAAGQRVKTLLTRGDAAWCDMTLVELWNGAQGHIEKKALEELEAEVQLYALNEPVWARARLLARRSREKGITATSADIVVAACAAEYGLELEHCDSHFDKILPIAAKL
ncbi:MAG: PIN domain-containing protein [Limisphaerales bacterium]